MKLLAALLIIFSLCCVRAQEAPMTLTVSADYLSLHVSGLAPIGSTGMEYRLGEFGSVAADAPWQAVPASPGADGTYAFDLPLTRSRWSALEVRAISGGKVVASEAAHGKPRVFAMLSEERVAALPLAQREGWIAYMKRSNERFESEWDLLAAECRELSLPNSNPAPSARTEFDFRSDSDVTRFLDGEAGRLLEAVMSYQTPSGAWSKAVDYSKGRRQPGTHWTSQSNAGWHYCGTLDNRSTTAQIRFLAAAHLATKRRETLAAALRGIEWVLAAQFPNGGWPQNYPVEPGYHEAVTLNDNAMLHAMELLLDLSQGSAPFSFADENLRLRAREAFDRAIEWIRTAQVKVDGVPTVWCAQHDPLTLEPVAARKKEPPSLSGAESAELLKFLMRRAPVSPEIRGIVEHGVEWLKAHCIAGLRKTKTDGKTDYVPDESSTEIYWARFYDVQTGKPIFAGADDGIIYATFGEMAARNKIAYDYFTTKPGELIDQELDRWRKRMP